jgi:hypothetical protein
MREHNIGGGKADMEIVLLVKYIQEKGVVK